MLARLAGCVPDIRRITAMGADLYTLRQRRGRNTNSYQNVDPTGGSDLNQFALDHARIYLSGTITPNISVMFNTDYNSATNNMGILDAVGQFHISPRFNVWFGRFLPPSDRDNFTGPFYSNEWAVYTDGIQDGYAAVFQGRDNGVAYWGDFKAGIAKIKALGGRIRRRFRGREFGCHLCRPRSTRFLGSGGRLLPQQYLLWG